MNNVFLPQANYLRCVKYIMLPYCCTFIWICGLLEAELHICVYVGKKQINNCLGLIYSLPWPDTQTANQGTREIPVVRFQIVSSLLFAYAHKRGRCFFVLPVIFGFEP